MKIIKTRKRTEVEIKLLELREMQHSNDLALRQCASEVLMVLQEINYPKVNIGVDFAEKGGKDESCIVCGVGFGPNPLHGKEDYLKKFFPNFKTSGTKNPNLTKKTLSECIDAVEKETARKQFAFDIFKTENDVRKEEREKVVDEVINIIHKYLVFGEEKVSYKAAELCYRIKKLIRKESKS